MAKNLTTPVSVRLSDEELLRFRALCERHGGPKTTFMAALSALEGAADPTNDELLALLARRLARSAR